MNWGGNKILLSLVAIFLLLNNSDAKNKSILFDDNGISVLAFPADLPPPSYDNLVIDTFSVYENGLAIAANDTLTINDTLLVYGNLELANKSYMTLREGAVCIVYGDVITGNTIDLSFNSYFIVTGSLTHVGSSNNVELNVGDSASVYILGDVNEDFTTMVCDSTSVSNYDPPGGTGCERGDIIALEDNENGDGGLYDFIVNGDSIKGITPVYSEICFGETVALTAIYTDGSDYIWCDSMGTPIDTTTSFQYDINESGEYFVKIVPADGGDTIYSHRAKVVWKVSSQPISLVCPPDTILEANLGECGIVVNLPLLFISDDCSVTDIFNSKNGNGADASDSYDIGLTEVVYSVVENNGTTATCTTYVAVYPNQNNYISANFTSPTTTITAGESIDFTNTALNSSATFLWSFPGAVQATSTVQNPTEITYNSPGTYTVTLVVTNSCESVTKTATVKVVSNSSQTFVSGGDFTVPNCVSEITVEAWGAGGGGNLVDSDNGGGGGGGGAYARSSISVTSGTVFPVVVGSGGGVNLAGGNSGFGNGTVIAAGGGSLTSSLGAPGGQVGNSTGDTLVAGGNGGSYALGGGGGGGGSAFTNSVGENGNDGFIAGGVGGDGTGFGGNGGAFWLGAESGNIPGGGGGGNGYGNLIAGTGANGLVVVTWTVNAQPEITIDSIPSVPQGSTFSNIYYSGISGSPTSYSIEFSAKAIDSGFVNVPYTALEPSPISVVIPSLSVPDYYGGILKVQTIDSCESVEIPIIISIIDTEPPVITCPDTIRVNTDSLCFATNVDLLELTARDNAYPDGLVSSDSPAPPGREIIIVNDAPDIFPIDTTIVTWLVADASGNIATCEQLVIVSDIENPQITCPPDISVNTDLGTCGATLTIGQPTVVENCEIRTMFNDYNYSSDASDFYLIGETVIIWTVLDRSYNLGSCTQTIAVTDNEDPVITCPIDTIIYTDTDTSGAFVNYITPIGTDNCAETNTLQLAGQASGAFFLIGETVNVFEATDFAGNRSTCSFKITVKDTVPPELNCPDTIRVSTDSACFATNVDLLELSATDNAFDGGKVYSNSPPPPGREIIIVNDAPDIFPIDTTIVTWTVVDPSGNVATCEQLVIVEDNELPTITCATPEISYDADLGECYFTVPDNSLNPIDSSDNCTIVSVLNDFNSSSTLNGTQLPVGTTIVTWTVADSSGNIASCQQTIVVTSEIDVSVLAVPDYCQSGETNDEIGDLLSTNVSWTINRAIGLKNWSFDYVINDGTTDVASGTVNDLATGSTTVSYDSPNKTAVDIILTITISNVLDDCGSGETNNGNNSDTVTLFGVPATTEIITDN